MRTIIVRKLGPRNWMCYVAGKGPVLLTDIKRSALALEIGQSIVQNAQYL